MQKVTQCLILPTRSYCVVCALGFCNQVLFDEVKNFTTNNIFKLLQLITYQDLCKMWHFYIEGFRGSEALEGFYCKFIYENCRVQGQKFCTRSETSLYYSELLLGRFPLRFFTVELICFIGFLGSLYLVLFTILLCMILT